MNNNLILLQLSKDWLILVDRAAKAKLHSSNPRIVQQFINDNVNGTIEKKAEIFMALLDTLSKSERLDGGGRIIVPMNNASNQQERKSQGSNTRELGRISESERNKKDES